MGNNLLSRVTEEVLRDFAKKEWLDINDEERNGFLRIIETLRKENSFMFSWILLTQQGEDYASLPGALRLHIVALAFAVYRLLQIQSEKDNRKLPKIKTEVIANVMGEDALDRDDKMGRQGDSFFDTLGVMNSENPILADFLFTWAIPRKVSGLYPENLTMADLLHAWDISDKGKKQKATDILIFLLPAIQVYQLLRSQAEVDFLSNTFDGKGS